MKKNKRRVPKNIIQILELNNFYYKNNISRSKRMKKVKKRFLKEEITTENRIPKISSRILSSTSLIATNRRRFHL